jgi:hypothetical protein
MMFKYREGGQGGREVWKVVEVGRDLEDPLAANKLSFATPCILFKPLIL